MAEPAGQITVAGRAGPDERVRINQLDGTAHGVTADSAGLFSVSIPAPTPTNRLFNLSVERAGRSVSSDGWLFSPAQNPARSVMLRIGGASLPVGPAPLLAVVDMDAGGGVALSGRAAEGATVSVSIDGQARGTVRVGPDGRWFTVLSATVAPGSHQILVTAGDQRNQRELSLVPQPSPGTLDVAEVEGAVRIAWALPGGGNQTTWILMP